MDEPLDEYRPVSRLAVAALVAGVGSATALVGPVFWVVPVVAVGLAVAALRDLARPGVAKVGHPVALAGLALAVGFGAQAAASTLTTRWLTIDRARAAASFWIDTLCEDREGAIDAARGMMGRDLREEATSLAECCRGAKPVVGRGGPGDLPGTWSVQASTGACDLQIDLVRSPATAREAERWLVIGCRRVTRSSN